MRPGQHPAGHRPKRVLVTGGAGFIGSHVADRFLAEECEVAVLDDLSTGRGDQVPAGARFAELDLCDPAVDDLFAEGRFDLISHHAAQIDVRVSVADPARDARTNIMGLLHLLECARRHSVKRFIFASSGGVLYGETGDAPATEDHPLRPVSPYGVAKLAGEYYLHGFERLHGLDYAALRYGNVYGPRQSPHGEAGVVAIFGNRILAGEPITIYGDGDQVRDYVHVSDVVEANWLAGTRPLPPVAQLTDRGWNIGTGQGTSVNDLARRMMAISDREVPRVKAPARAGELERNVLDPARALADLGWRPAVGLDEGLAGTLAWLESAATPREVP